MQLAVLGFLAIYFPVLVLVGVSAVTETSVLVDDAMVTATASTERSPWMTWTVIVLAPAAAGVAWWLAGRAVRPIERFRALAEDIKASDLSRRVGLERGPTEILALATTFDAMLDRLEHAADGQRRLIEEASHELRTPLTLLRTNADVLLAHRRPTLETYRQGLERSQRAAARLQSTIDELLVDARGRVQVIARPPVDLMAIIRHVVEDARLLGTAKALDVSITGPTIAECVLDEPAVVRALTNLVDNAVRFAPPASAVEIAVAITDAEAIVVVTDHGPGIPTDQQPHIFNRSWQGRADNQGSGLGLPIAQHIAVAHGGSLTVRSPGPTGDGSAFELRLRRSPTTRPGRAPPAS